MCNEHFTVAAGRGGDSLTSPGGEKYSKYNFKVLLLEYLSIFCYFILLLHYDSEANVVLFISIHVFTTLLCRFRFNNTKYNHQIKCDVIL